MPDHIESVKGVATYLRGLAERNKERPEFFERLSGHAASLDDAADDMARLMALTKALPPDLGNVYELPAELREELSVLKTDETEDQIVTAINAQGGTATLDQILVGIYRKFGVVQKRRFVQGKLYRMEMVWPVDGRKGIYTTTKPEATSLSWVDEMKSPAPPKSREDMDDEIPF
jgi:hypothetical protein